MSRDTSGFDEAKVALEQESADIAFLIGNGINHATSQAGGISWDELIKKLVDNAKINSNNPQQVKRLEGLWEVNSHDRKAASLPEFFDIIDTISKGSTERSDLQKQIAELLRDMQPGIPHQSLVNWAVEKRIPILTTNYDHCLQDAKISDPCKRLRFGDGKAMPDRYPWDRYYAPTKISDPLQSFAVWHIHGDRDLKRSIRAGLDQYMGMVARLRTLKAAIAKEALAGLNTDEANPPQFHQAPWMRIFMGKKLWIQGLGLNADEVSLRWLLIQRFRYRSRYRPDEPSGWNGWYVHGPTVDNKIGLLDAERRAFVQALGLQVIEIERQEHLYDELFSQRPPKSTQSLPSKSIQNQVERKNQ